jgi:hypothetical protein
VLPRLALLTKWRVLRTARVLLCTIDSVSRMVYQIEDAADEAEEHGYRGWTLDAGELL